MLDYLRAAEVVLGTDGMMDDVVDRIRLGAVPADFRSDGRWVWPDAVTYYLDGQHLAPEPALAAHAWQRTPWPCRGNRPQWTDWLITAP